jgi:hypothetical protein
MRTVIASNTIDLPGMYNRRMAEQSTVRLLNHFVLLYFIKPEKNTYVYLLTDPIDSERYECVS